MERKEHKIQQWISIAVAVISIIFVPVAMYQSITKKEVSEIRTTVIEAEFNELEERVKKIEGVSDKLESQLTSISNAIEQVSKNPESLDKAKLSHDCSNCPQM